MSFFDGVSFAPTSAGALAVWFLILTVALYFTRIPMHRALVSLARVTHRAMRIASSSVMRAEQKLSARNREVLLAAGREASERIIEREFERVDATVRRDIAECPTLHRKMSEEITLIEEDHQASAEVPPAPPGWVDAVDAVAQIPARSEPVVGKILEQIHGTLARAQEEAIDEYRSTTQSRHQHLTRMMPHWRKLMQLVTSADKNVNKLIERTKIIDRQMEDYENVLKKTDRAQQMLSSSSLNQFFISALVLAIAIGGAIINFHLIARPMAEMVGGNSTIGSFHTSDIAALVIILVEVSMGLFLMESLRITRLFPVINALPDKLRVKMIWITFTILTLLATVEAGLAYMREILLQDSLATSAALRGEVAAVVALDFTWITTAAQMGLGFILPFALVFVAIPLETFVQALRTVLGIAGAGFLRGLAAVLRVTGNAARYGGDLLRDVYDLLIFAPLWIETQIKKTPLGANGGSNRKAAHAAPADGAATMREAM